jgi:hypothetical protein
MHIVVLEDRPRSAELEPRREFVERSSFSGRFGRPLSLGDERSESRKGIKKEEEVLFLGGCAVVL